MAEQGFPVVGVGVSAGGIGALEALFRGLPVGCGMAFVVGSQFSHRESLLLQAIGRFADMPVVMAEDGTRVRPGSVYVMAQGVGLTMEAGMLLMRKALMREGHPVEAFFGSLAKKVGEYAVGVVFSGGEKRGEEIRFVNRIVEPWEASEPLYLVLFEASEQRATKAEISGRHGSLGLADPERELREVKGRLRSTVEGYEAALEDLKSAKAELEALRGKMQALSAVNAELAFKLDRADSDLKGLFESSRVVAVFLDSSLAIRSFTPAAGAVFGFLPSDIGRPFSDLIGGLDYPELQQHLAAVLDTGEAIEHRFARGKTGTPYLVRLVPHLAGQGIVVTFIEATTGAEGEKQHGLLISELNHRVKNMLAVVISIVSLTGRQSEATAAFSEVLIGRLQAMARAYGVLSRDNWTDASLTELLQLELEGFGEGRAVFSGADLRVKPRQGLSLSMVFHELATNAVRFGALSEAGGTVRIGWAVEDGQLRLHWQEVGGPEVRDPETNGFGLMLIKGEITYRLAGKVDLAFEREGLEVTLSMPLDG